MTRYIHYYVRDCRPLVGYVLYVLYVQQKKKKKKRNMPCIKKQSKKPPEMADPLFSKAKQQ